MKFCRIWLCDLDTSTVLSVREDFLMCHELHNTTIHVRWGYCLPIDAINPWHLDLGTPPQKRLHGSVIISSRKLTGIDVVCPCPALSLVPAGAHTSNQGFEAVRCIPLLYLCYDQMSSIVVFPKEKDLSSI